MGIKPTYEELKQRVKELEKLEAEHKRNEKDLQDVKQKWTSLMENTNDFIMIIDDNCRIQYINKAIPPNTVEQVVGRTLYYYAALEHHEIMRRTVENVFETQKQGSYTSSVKHPTGIQWFETIVVPIIEEGKVISAMSFNKIITESKRAEEKLWKSEKKYRALASKLEVKNKSLEELNTAMKVLLEKRIEDKIKLEDNVMTNTKELIGPLIVNMRETELNDHQKMILSILESNLDEITSNFTRKLSLEHLNLTPTEMKIANYIKHGTTTKKIAEIMKSSPRTIETHRKNIREKVGLKQGRRNLRSYLLSLH